MKAIFTLVFTFGLTCMLWSQSLIPNPWTFASCTYGVSPIGWTNCNTSPDCAASRCTVPAGCSGQAVMCFGESFYYMLASPLVIGQNYTVTMNVSTGQLGVNSIIAGNHTFNVIGLTSAPTNCAGPFGNVCSTPGSTLLLSGTVNTIGWVAFSNTFTATSAIRYIVIGNCDGTGNGGNLFCNFTLSNSIIFPVALQSFDATASGCDVDLNWSVGNENGSLDHFEVLRSSEGKTNEVVATVKAYRGVSDYAFSDLAPMENVDYQLSLHHADGSVSQSQVVHVAGDCAAPQLTIEGNPVQGNETTLRYNATGLPMRLTISNVEGRIVHEGAISPATAGWQRLRLDVSSLRPGIYFVSTGDGQVTKLHKM